jgi:hypothetical protein
MSTDLAVGGMCSVPLHSTQRVRFYGIATTERRRDDADDPSAAVGRGADKDNLPYYAYCKSLGDGVPNRQYKTCANSPHADAPPDAAVALPYYADYLRTKRTIQDRVQNAQDKTKSIREVCIFGPGPAPQAKPKSHSLFLRLSLRLSGCPSL